MFVFDLFNNKGTVSEAGNRPEPEQEIIDATRRARLQSEREPAGSENIDAMLAQQHAQLQQYEQSGKFWLKTKVEQKHIQGPFVGKATANAAAIALLKQAPELKGNLVITAYGPEEQQNVEEGSVLAFEKDPFERWKKNIGMAYPNLGPRLKFVSKDNGNKVVALDPVTRLIYGEFETQTMRGRVFDVADNNVAEVASKQRLDPKCWTGKKIGNPKTKVKGGVRVNNCVPAEGMAEGSETPEKEIERLKLRQNAEHGRASLKRQAETQARIRELEKAQKNQGVAEGEVIPFARKPQSNLTWQQLPKDVLKLANDWFWADMDDSGLDAVLDPKGYGSGTQNDVQYITAQLQQRGWAIDHNDENDPDYGPFNIILTNKRGQSVLLPKDDAERFRGWAQGTNSNLREGSKKSIDPNFVGFMNKTMANQVDKPKVDPLANAPTWYKNAPAMNFSAMPSHKKALQFGLAALSKLDPAASQQLAIKGEAAIVSYLLKAAKQTKVRLGFVEEDLWECQDYLSDVFHDPNINSWVDVLKQNVTEDAAGVDVAEATGDVKFDKMLKGITGKKEVAKQQKIDTKQQARDAFGGMFGGGNPADKLSIRKKGVAEGGYNPDTFVGKKGTYKGYGITQEGPHQWGISSSAKKFTTLAAAKRHIDKILVVSEQGMAEGTLNEADSHAEVGLTGNQFHSSVRRIMQDLVEEYRNEVQASTSTPSAPDTSKFMAQRGGMIEYATKLNVHGGYYGGNTQYIDFIKIGGGLPTEVKQSLLRDFAADMEDQFDLTVAPGLHVKTTDGYTFFFPTPETGTNWGGFGFTVSKSKTQEGVAEGGFKNMYAEFSGYGNYMQGRAVNVFNKAGLEIVSKEYSEDDDIQTYVVKGDRWAIEKAGKFLERNAEQFGGYHFVKQGVSENYPKHQDLSSISTDKLKAYLAKQAKQSVPGEGSQVKRVQAELQRRSQGVAEGSSGVSVRQWANQVRKDHGADVKFKNRQEGGGAVDSVIARNSQGETVGVYNRKTGYPTVYEPKQGVAEGDAKFDTMMGNIAKPSAVKALGREEKVHELIRKYFWHKRRADLGSAVTGEHGHDRMVQKVLMTLKKMNVDLSTMDPSKLKAIKGEVYEQGVTEGSEEDYKNQRMWDQHNDDTEDLGIISQGEYWAGIHRNKQRQLDKEQQKKDIAEAGYSGVDDTDTVGFSVNSERAYQAVMSRFGNQVDHDETSGTMYVPARLWPQVEMIAFDADGEGASRDDEGIAEGTIADQPRIRKYSKIRADGSKAERYEVLDYQGRRVAGQGAEGFDDLKYAKEFFKRNYNRLINPMDEDVLTAKTKKKEKNDSKHPGKKMLESKKRYWCSIEKRWKETDENKESN